MFKERVIGLPIIGDGVSLLLSPVSSRNKKGKVLSFQAERHEDTTDSVFFWLSQLQGLIIWGSDEVVMLGKEKLAIKAAATDDFFILVENYDELIRDYLTRPKTLSMLENTYLDGQQLGIIQSKNFNVQFDTMAPVPTACAWGDHELLIGVDGDTLHHAMLIAKLANTINVLGQSEKCQAKTK